MYRFIKQNITRNIQNNTIRDINSCVATIIAYSAKTEHSLRMSGALFR